MTEVERYKLCQHLPRLACGLHFRVARDLVQAYLTDARWLLSVSDELQQEYNAAQQKYETLSPYAKALVDRLLPWILHLRVRYGDACADTILANYPQIRIHARLYGLLSQAN